MARGLLGIDLGTGSAKAIVVAMDGSVLGRGSAEYPIHQPMPGYAEQDPEEWWRGTVRAVRAALADAGDVNITAIGLSGQMHGTVLVGADGEAIGPAIIWADTRSARQVEEITELIGAERLIELAGSPLAVGFQAATIRWVQQEQPERWARVQIILLPKDYFRWRLTGVYATEPSDASSTLLLDVRTRDWSDEILRGLGVRRDQLPVIAESTAATGKLNSEAAAELGLPTGTPVIAGGADAPLAALAAGVVDPASMLLTISTGSQVILPTYEARIDPKGRIHTWCSCLAPEADRNRDSATGAAWYQMGATMASGLAMRWLRDRVFDLPQEDAYDRMSSWAAKTPPGAGGLLFLPYLAGERTPHMDPQARGLFLGLTADHDRGHLTRAVMEGATLALYDAYLVLASLGATPRQAILAGGGVRSALWRQIVADVFGIPILPLATVEGSAMGAALIAGAGVGELELTSAARAWARYDVPVLPNTQAHAIYEQLLPVFHSAYVKHREDFRFLASLASRS
ncbi:MAG: xylulokinase [Thermomicrobiales bacterium]|jgi:xylulokinase|nr:xylulokinase [Thermomicrobiales bacterium]